MCVLTEVHKRHPVLLGVLLDFSCNVDVTPRSRAVLSLGYKVGSVGAHSPSSARRQPLWSSYVYLLTEKAVGNDLQSILLYQPVSILSFIPVSYCIVFIYLNYIYLFIIAMSSCVLIFKIAYNYFLFLIILVLWLSQIWPVVICWAVSCVLWVWPVIFSKPLSNPHVPGTASVSQPCGDQS